MNLLEYCHNTIKNNVQHCSLENIDDKAIYYMANIIPIFHMKYGIKIFYIGTTKGLNQLTGIRLRDRKYGWALSGITTKGQFITINKKNLKRKRFLDVIIENEKSGYHPENTGYAGIIWHELGHILHFATTKNIDMLIREKFSNSKNIEEHISTYAETNHREFWAELYSMYELGLLKKYNPFYDFCNNIINKILQNNP